MEQDVDTGYRTVCSTCLSSDRDLFSLNSMPQILQIFRLLTYDYAGDALDIIPLVCWECVGHMKHTLKFKWQVHNAQEHLRVLTLNHSQESVDHAYLSQSLSTLVMETKTDYDKIFFDYTADQIVVEQEYDLETCGQDSIKLDLEDNILEEIVLDNTSADMLSHLVVDSHSLPTVSVFTHVKREGGLPSLTIHPLTGPNENVQTVISQTPKEESTVKDKTDSPKSYITEYMTEEEMLASREQMKKNVQYASSVYKCELCIIGFYLQQQVEKHFEVAHREKPGLVSCKVCYSYIEDNKLTSHINQHHMRYKCKMCGQVEYSVWLIQIHVKTHTEKSQPTSLIRIVETSSKQNKKKKKSKSDESSPQPGDLRKLLSKTTIEGYKCLECDMFFKNCRARKTHFDRFHREGLQCDHCQKRFVNKNTLATHLKLHEGPLPRKECPICHKMVREIQLKYHIQRHQNTTRYECLDCKKIFSHLATYQAHLKYSRAHATETVLKFPCPMCHKGYPTKEAMQDHFNYQHLGKTAHKCPICDKPIASKSNVDKHIARVHKEKKEKPRKHICQLCGKPFTDKKSLTQHEAIHSSLRPLTCDICHLTFKQKASLYTHRKRVHKVFPVKKQVHYIDDVQ